MNTIVNCPKCDGHKRVPYMNVSSDAMTIDTFAYVPEELWPACDFCGGKGYVTENEAKQYPIIVLLWVIGAPIGCIIMAAIAILFDLLA